MPSPKLQAARQLIENKEYTAARSVLTTISEPAEDVVTAARWMAKLDSMAAAKQAEARAKGRRRVQVWGLALVGVVLVIILLAKAIADNSAETRARIDRMLEDSKTEYWATKNSVFITTPTIAAIETSNADIAARLTRTAGAPK